MLKLSGYYLSISIPVKNKVKDNEKLRHVKHYALVYMCTLPNDRTSIKIHFQKHLMPDEFKLRKRHNDDNVHMYCSSLTYPYSVSYTHLDVYKRQIYILYCC